MNRGQRGILGGIVVATVFTGSTAVAGLPDVLGMQLGMPAREAYAKLQAQLPGNDLEIASVHMPSIEKPVIATMYSKPRKAVMMGDEADIVTVDVTLPPNKQAVWRVDRIHRFPDKGIPRTTVLASLREKYGKESRAMDQTGRTTSDQSQIVSLLWLVDEQGAPATLPPLSGGNVDPLWTCKSMAEGSGAMLVESPPPMQPGATDATWCLASFTAVMATLNTGPLPETLEQLQVRIVSLPIAARAGAATMKWKEEIAAGQHQRDLEAAQKQAKPKL